MEKVKELTKSRVFEVVNIYKEYNKEDAEIIKEVYTKFYNKPKKRRNPNVKDYILLKDNKVIAFSGYNKEETETTDIFWLNWTAVKKDYLNNGYGRELINFIKEKILEKGGRKLYVSTSSKSPGAISFYQKLGFNKEATLKDYYRDGEDSIILSMRL